MSSLTSTPLRWGLLGTGAIAGTFAQALAQSSAGRLQAVGSRRLKSARDFCAQHGPATAHDSYESLLADPQVDAVYISTPHPWHAEWTLRAAAAGKHILCEKPLAMNHAEALQMVEAARAKDVFLMEAFMYRAHPQTARMVEILQSGMLGEPRSMRASFSFGGYFDPASRLFNRELGGGGILDVGCYPVSMSRLIAGVIAGKPFAEPARVTGAGHIGETGVDEHAVALLEFPGGFNARISCGLRVQEENELVIFGTEGTLTVPSPWFCGTDTGGAALIVARTKERSRDIERLPAGEGLYAYEIDTVAANLARREAPCMTLDDSLGNMRVLDQWLAEVAKTHPS